MLLTIYRFTWLPLLAIFHQWLSNPLPSLWMPATLLDAMQFWCHHFSGWKSASRGFISSEMSSLLLGFTPLYHCHGSMPSSITGHPFNFLAPQMAFALLSLNQNTLKWSRNPGDDLIDSKHWDKCFKPSVTWAKFLLFTRSFWIGGCWWVQHCHI